MYDHKEMESINELRNRLKPELNNDMYEDEYMFFRFLKYNDFDIDASEKMLKKHLEWRKALDVDNFSQYKIPKVLEKYLPHAKIGHDKQGCIVRYIASGNTDWIGLFSSCKYEDFLKFVTYIHEMDNLEFKEQVKKFGKKSGKVLYIHDLANFSFTQATDKKVISNFIHLVNVYINNYPKTLKAVVVINASMYFYLTYSLVKKFLPNAILQKVVVFSDDSFKEELRNRIDSDILPAFLGGKRTDPDGNPLCLSFINQGGPVPEKYYIHKSKRSLASLPDVKKLTLSHATFHEELVEVKEPESYLEWEIEIKSRDIGFGLFYQDEEENKTEIVPLQRINTDEYAESGIYKCQNIGTYIILFDNTYSYLRSKVIYYKIKVLSPRDEVLVLNESQDITNQ